MSKHKKTRKEKIVADYRHQVYILKNKDVSLSKNSPTVSEVDQKSYFGTHVLRDVLKTGILTCSLIAAQIIFFFLLKNHIVTLPIVKY